MFTWIRSTKNRKIGQQLGKIGQTLAKYRLKVTTVKTMTSNSGLQCFDQDETFEAPLP